MTRENKQCGLQCVEGLGDDPILGNSSLTDSDDDGVDAGLLAWAASLGKVSETQVSNLESEPQPDTTLGNEVKGFDSQDTQLGDTKEVTKKKKKKKPHSLVPFQ